MSIAYCVREPLIDAQKTPRGALRAMRVSPIHAAAGLGVVDSCRRRGSTRA